MPNTPCSPEYQHARLRQFIEYLETAARALLAARDIVDEMVEHSRKHQNISAVAGGACVSGRLEILTHLATEEAVLARDAFRMTTAENN